MTYTDNRKGCVELTCTLAKSTRLRSDSIWLIWEVFCSTARAAWARWFRDVYLRRVCANADTTVTCGSQGGRALGQNPNVLVQQMVHTFKFTKPLLLKKTDCGLTYNLVMESDPGCNV